MSAFRVAGRCLGWVGAEAGAEQPEATKQSPRLERWNLAGKPCQAIAGPVENHRKATRARAAGRGSASAPDPPDRDAHLIISRRVPCVTGDGERGPATRSSGIRQKKDAMHGDEGETTGRGGGILVAIWLRSMSGFGQAIEQIKRAHLCTMGTPTASE